MLWIPAADIAGSRLEGAIVKGGSFADAVICGSSYETSRGIDVGERVADFIWFDPRSTFTDDTVLTAGIMEWILTGGDGARLLRKWIRKYPDCGFGKYTRAWGLSEAEPPRAVGNGAAIRSVPFAYAFESEPGLRALARESAAVTHTSDSAIDGAEAIALAVFRARKGEWGDDLRATLSAAFPKFDFGGSTDSVRAARTGFSSDCTETVPPAIFAALESGSFEEAVRRAVSAGGDTDSIAVMAGAVAAAKFGVPEEILAATYERLPEDIRSVFREFEERYL